MTYDEGPSRTDDSAGSQSRLDVAVIGSALVDVLSHASDAQIEDMGLSKGSMTLVDLDESSKLYRQMGPTAEISGGSAANTAVGVAMLGGKVGYIGKVSEDAFGEIFSHDIVAVGVEPGRSLRRQGGAKSTSDGKSNDQATGRCLVFVTPDGERTMATHLGVSSTLTTDDLDEEMLARAEVLYLEGYLWDLDDAKRAMRRAVEVAHSAEALVAMTVSDPFCVNRHRKDFLELVNGDLDILFANEEEARLLFGSPDLDHVLSSLSQTGLLAAVTRGPLGSVVVGAGGASFVEPVPVDRVVDTTGAGDLYAAGFLYGLTHGKDPESCAQLGSVCAAEVISHLGARPEADLKALV